MLEDNPKTFSGEISHLFTILQRPPTLLLVKDY